MSHLIRLWYFSSSVSSVLKRACAAIRIFGRALHLLPYFMYTWAFAGRLCDK